MAIRKDRKTSRTRSNSPSNPPPKKSTTDSQPDAELSPAQKKLLKEFQKIALELTKRGDGDQQANEAASQLERERLEIKIANLNEQIKRLRAERRKQLTDEEIRDQIKAAIFEITQMPPKMPDWITKPSVSGKDGDQTIMVPMVMASDWHYGEVVNRKEVGGVNEFNLEIGDRRIEQLVNDVIKSCRSRNYSYPGIVFALGGDMISGDDLHQELTTTNQARTTQVLLRVEGQLIAAIERMADEFGNVFVPCVVGNHGRNTHKPQFKGKVYTNYEWYMYRTLEKHFRNDPRVTFLIPDEADAHFKIQNHRYMLTHGDTLGVKGGDGIIGTLGPIMRGKVKLSNSEKQIGRDFDTLLMGHWHTYISLKGVIVNGSLKGYDEYARLALRASYEEPIQALWFNHPIHGPTDFTPIRLSNPAKVGVAPVETRWESLVSTDRTQRRTDDISEPARVTAKAASRKRPGNDAGQRPGL